MSNKHFAEHQIRMSSPLIGDALFDDDPETGEWVSPNGEGTLSDLLADELRSTTGTEFTLD